MEYMEKKGIARLLDKTLMYASCRHAHTSHISSQCVVLANERRRQGERHRQRFLIDFSVFVTYLKRPG